MNSIEQESGQADPKWLYGFLLLQFSCQLALLTPLGPLRIWFRILTFSSSLAMLVLVPTRGISNPARPLVIAILVIGSLGLIHPNLNSLLAGLGQIAITTAVWAPLFWTARIKMPPNVLRNVFLLIWVFNTASSVVGMLQIYDPERFAPDPIFVQQLMGVSSDGLRIELADGRTVWRPMGLTDSPGGAAASGQFAFLAGLIVAISDRRVFLRLAGLAGAVIGMFCIYLCQVRTTVVLTGISSVVYIAVSSFSHRPGRATLLAGLGSASVIVAFLWAENVGGVNMTDRLSTLTGDRIDQVYYANRGIFLEETISKVQDYPLGAGLGRWGMISSYFGDLTNPNSQPLHVEIQATAWLYDGGWLLLAIGFLAIFAICLVSLGIALSINNQIIADWAALTVALNVGMVANCFTYPVFAGQAGMMCLLLNGVVFTTSVYHQSKEEPVSFEGSV